MGFKGLVAGLLALAVAWIAPVAAQAQGAEQRVASLIAGPTGGVAPTPPVEPQEQAPSREADRSTNEDEAADGETEASATQTGGDEGESDAPADAEEPVGQAAQDDEGDRDCPDFSSQEEAQEFFEDQGGPEEDPNRLDADDDGEACEDFFSDTEDSVSDGVPSGGVDAGVGEDDPAPPSAGPLFLVGLGGMAVAGLLGTTLILRRRAR